MNLCLSKWALVAVATTGLGLGCAGNGANDASSSSGRVDYTRQVRPILEKNCYECHGPVQVPSGKLRFDTRAGLLAGGRSGQPSVIPGHADDSPLYIAITGGGGDGDGDRTWQAMPPHGKRLKANDIQTLRRWIDQGASFGAE